jgi:hypothetical protein
MKKESSETKRLVKDEFVKLQISPDWQQQGQLQI